MVSLEKPKGNMREYFNEPMAMIPIKAINFSDSDEVERYNIFISHVNQILQSKKDYIFTKSETDRKLYEQKINILDKKIDELVYKLYDISVDEIKINLKVYKYFIYLRW